MLIKKWKIRIQSDGRPAITFPSGRQDGVLLPEAEDIELSDEGLIFSISRRGKITRYECPFNELGYTAPPTPIAQLQAIYTHTKHLDRLVINALKKLDIDILLAVCVDEDYVYGILSAVKDFEAVNFDYGNDLFNYCRKFEYDWKRDLPDIAQLIDMKYPEGCEVILTYKEWFEAGVICDKKIFAKTLLKEKLRSRRLAIMLIDFMKDKSVRLSKINSTKNPDTRLLFDDLPSVADDVKRTFYLIIDIDETIRSERDIVDYCIYGGWINKEFVEVLGKEEALPIFEDLIPFILREEMILCG